MQKYINIYLFIILIAAFTACKGTNQEKEEETKTCHYQTLAADTEVDHPIWANDAVIYEVNIRQYTPEGTFKAFEQHLPRLQELGVEILWLMPIYPISEKNRKGSLGSYYSISNYKAVNPEFGTIEDFKSLVEKAHSMGFKIILDWVANHTGWDHKWIEKHPEWYTSDAEGNIIAPVEDWSDVADLNYNNAEMRKAMIDALSYWVTDTDIDGFRCDVAGMVPVDFWNEARTELDKLKPVFMLAEDEAEIALLEKAFNMNYGWDFHHIINEIAQGKATATSVVNYFAKADSIWPTGSYMMQFTSNHDENSWNGTAFERMGDATQTLAALTFTVPGMPLIYSGQEAGLNKRLDFFEKDDIDWSDLKMQDFYKKLVEIKQQNPALWNGCAGANIKFFMTNENVLVFSREQSYNKVLGIFNLSEKPVTFSLNYEETCGTFINDINEEKETITQNKPINLNGWEYKILTAR